MAGRVETPITEVPAVAQPTAARIVHTLRQSVRPKTDVPDSDQELLAQFVQHRDETAFRSLVHRHGKTVLTACRQVLTDPADIDDAFQASFLVLLKKAKKVDGSCPLGGWLFAVAHRVAVRSRADRIRRQICEAEAARRQRATMESPDLSWREAAAVLHDELNTLPDKYRLPLLLCSVQGLTRDEAAEQLGTTVGAIRGQLERGRALLERRLTRRGVTLSAGLLAVLVGGSSAAGGPPAELIDLAVRACGQPSSAGAALAQGAFPVTTVLKRTLLAAALALGLTAGVGLVPRYQPATARDAPPVGKDQPPTVQAKAEPKKQPENAKERAVSGTVVGHDGKPVAADLKLVWAEGPEQPIGKTNADGTFAVTIPARRDGHGGWLVATAPGHGPDALRHGIDYYPQSLKPASGVTLRLPKERPIKGRLVTQEGKPAAAAKVWVRSVAIFNSDADADRKLANWAALAPLNFRVAPPPEGVREVHYHGYGGRFGAEERSPHSATTDKDGRFELAGVGVGQVAVVYARGDGIAKRRLICVNRDGFDPKPLNTALHGQHRETLAMGGKVALGGGWEVFGADPVVVADKEKVIRGTVTRTDGKPVAGVRVVFTQVSDVEANPYYQWAVTGQDGRYEIRGASKREGYTVETAADPAAGLLPARAEAKDTAGFGPVTIDLTCRRGVVVSGRVTDRATGAPIPARFEMMPAENNPARRDFESIGQQSAALRSNSLRTDADGRFRVVTIPGPILLEATPLDPWRLASYKPAVADPARKEMFTTTSEGDFEEAGTLKFFGPNIRHQVRGCWCRVVDAKVGDEVKVEVALAPATRTVVRVVDADGKPVPGARAAGVSVLDPWLQPAADGDAVTVYGVEGKDERLVALCHPERKLVGVLVVKAGDQNPVVKLGPGGTVTGRAVDSNGKPLAGLIIQVGFGNPAFLQPLTEACNKLHPTLPTTGANGEFRIDGVIPGQKFRLSFVKDGNYIGPSSPVAPEHTVARHGDTLKLGDLMLGSEK